LHSVPNPPTQHDATVMSETEEQLKARLRREAKEKNEAVAREAAEARARLRNDAEAPRHVTFSDEPPPSRPSRPTYHSGPLESKHGSWTLTDKEKAQSSFYEQRLQVQEKPKEEKVVVKEDYTGHQFGAKHDKERSTGFGDTSKEAAMPMHLRLRDNRKGAMVLNKQGGKSPWRVSCEVGDLEGEWETERTMRLNSLQKIRKRDEDGNLEEGYDEDILPHQLKHANERHKVKATHGVPDRTLRRYKGECDETLAGTNAKRKKWKRLEAPPSVDPMEVGDDADHMRAIAKKKKDELEKAAAKMRARVEAYENRMIDDESDQIPKPEGMLSLELKQKRLQAEGKDLYGREAYELQFLSIRWIDKKMIRERQKKREAQLALRERWKNSVKVDEKKAETFLEKVKKRLLRIVLGEKAVSRSMKGKGDPAFEKRMKVLNLARTCFMIMDADDSGTLSRDEILTALKEDKRVIGFMRECKEAVLRDLLDPEKIETNLEEVDADKSGEIDMEEWINAVRISASRRVVVSSTRVHLTMT
jgi:hypothetical protein